MSRSKLVELLKNHGVRAREANGQILAYDLYQDESGTVHERIVSIRPSKGAVLAFLGY